MDLRDKPHDNNPDTLFEYSVRKAVSKGAMGKVYTHKAWANIIFNYERNADMRSELMSIVKREYKPYFDNKAQYMFLEEKIKRFFPQYFGLSGSDNLFERIIDALNAEKEEQQNPRNLQSYAARNCRLFSENEEQKVYSVNIVVAEGDDPDFVEGTTVQVRQMSSGTYYNCDVVDYDYTNAVLYFSCSQKVSLYGKIRVYTDATMNITALIERIKEIGNSGIEEHIPLQKFLKGETEKLARLKHNNPEEYLEKMMQGDMSQYKTFKAALSRDITLIWGPPGTGKSYTLAAIVMALYHMSHERTAVCCLSNVAVDQLVGKVIDIIDAYEGDMQRGEFYRAGNTVDERVIATDFLYPDDRLSRQLRRKIRRLKKELEEREKANNNISHEAVNIKAQILAAREKLKEHTDYLISNVKVVFSTISNFVINGRLKDGDYDNLVVDEASMLALPQLIALAHNVKKRIILVGDFQQLSPITVAGIPILKESMFKHCGVDICHTSHNALHQLLCQRRSNPKIVDIINHAFYMDRLKAMNSRYHAIVSSAPFSNCVIGMKRVRDGCVHFTKGGTRQNEANARGVLELLEKYSRGDEDTFTIGVITPYRGQVTLLRTLVAEKTYDVQFQKRLKIGTVHTFQGSECDVIIFDMVDCSKTDDGKPNKFGRLFAGEEGERLLNVAVSRARHKLIVVCEPEFMERCSGGQITDRSYSVFKALLAARHTVM